MVTAPSRSVVNNAGLDPIQGFHTNVYVHNQASGVPVLLGGFTSFQKTMRNATEPYLPFGRKTPRLLDGENQYGFVLERGLIDVRVMEEVFGFSEMGPEFQSDATPRFVITVQFNAPELQGRGIFTRNQGSDTYTPTQSATRGQLPGERRAVGGYRLYFAKIDSVTIGAMAGRNVVATRIEGLCESIAAINSGAVIGAIPDQQLGQVQGTPSTPNTTNLQYQAGNNGRNYLFG
jgi:hypothetical protein